MEEPRVTGEDPLSSFGSPFYIPSFLIAFKDTVLYIRDFHEK